MQIKNSGFTLLEVLVAATILFAALSLSALGVKTLRESSLKAERRIIVLSVVAPLLEQIQFQLREEKLTAGQGTFDDVSYQWKAELGAFAAAPKQFDPDTGLVSQPEKRYRLYRVQLTLQYQGYQLEKQYQELAW